MKNTKRSALQFICDNINTILFSIIAIMILCYFKHCTDELDREYVVKAVITHKSVDTLEYGCGYKNKSRCVGVFNRIFYDSQYGEFIDHVCDCEYSEADVGDSVEKVGTEVQLWLWYDLHVAK